MATAVLSPAEILAKHRIPTLDGWRGVAILLVLVDHAARNGRFQDKAWASLGSLGVDIFFVLSGYLITARLLAERDHAATISLRGFYARRASCSCCLTTLRPQLTDRQL
jgi:peptidoglycan/LPS O-acetylase OafA/YrhL